MNSPLERIRNYVQAQDPRRRMMLAAAPFAVLLVLFGVYQAYLNAQFRIVDRNPSSSTLPTSTDTISFTFNRELRSLEEQAEDFVTLTPEGSSRI